MDCFVAEVVFRGWVAQCNEHAQLTCTMIYLFYRLSMELQIVERCRCTVWSLVGSDGRTIGLTLNAVGGGRKKLDQ